MTPELPDLAETAKFLRRFADLMSNGQNAKYLHGAAIMLETLTARIAEASEEEQLWRYKHETLTQYTDGLEAECEALKHDIEGHVNITSTILSERDALKSALQAQEEEISGLHAALDRERSELTSKLQALDNVHSEIRVAFDRERELLESKLQARGDELEQLRGELARDREDFEARSKAHQNELSEVRLAFDRERAELQVEKKVLGDELAAVLTMHRSESDALKMKIADLETKRGELRSIVGQIGNLRNLAVEHRSTERPIQNTPRLDTELLPLVAQRVQADPATGQTAVVPKTTLRQVRAQFEYLAKEFIPLGDIASQVMCELGAYTMDLALNAGGEIEALPVTQAALKILAPPGSTAPIIANRQ